MTRPNAVVAAVNAVAAALAVLLGGASTLAQPAGNTGKYILTGTDQKPIVVRITPSRVFFGYEDEVSGHAGIAVPSSGQRVTGSVFSQKIGRSEDWTRVAARFDGERLEVIGSQRVMEREFDIWSHWNFVVVFPGGRQCTLEKGRINMYDVRKDGERIGEHIDDFVSCAASDD